MGCAHGPHDCGAWYGGPYSDWSEEMDWPVRRRARRVRRADPDPSTDEIVARLDELRDEIRQVGAELEKLRGFPLAGNLDGKEKENPSTMTGTKTAKMIPSLYAHRNP